MIQAKLYRKNDRLCGFRISAHADYAPGGSDIVCAAVSVLAFNTVNAVEKFTEVPFQCEADAENGGYLKVLFPIEGMEAADVQLLLETLALGLAGIEMEYGSYITLKIEEV